jgi:hypothetical protein
MANPVAVKVPKSGVLMISAFDAGCDFELPIDLLTVPARVERHPGQPHAAPKWAGIGTHDSSHATICKEAPSGLSGGRGHVGIRHKGTTGRERLLLEASLRPHALRRDGQTPSLTHLSARAAQHLLTVMAVGSAGTPFAATPTDPKGGSESFEAKALATFIGTTTRTTP